MCEYFFLKTMNNELGNHAKRLTIYEIIFTYENFVCGIGTVHNYMQISFIHIYEWFQFHITISHMKIGEILCEFSVRVAV